MVRFSKKIPTAIALMVLTTGAGFTAHACQKKPMKHKKHIAHHHNCHIAKKAAPKQIIVQHKAAPEPSHYIRPMKDRPVHLVHYIKPTATIPDLSIAGQFCGPKYLHDGPYVGAELNYNSYLTTQRQFTTNTDLITSSFVNRPGTQAWGEKIFAGYGQYFQGPLYLAGEIFAQINNNANVQTTLPDLSTGSSVLTSLKTHRTYGIAILPGIELTNSSLAYLRLGYNNTNFTYKVSVMPSGFPAIDQTRNKTSGGFAFGVGIESLVYNKLSLRGEFTHTRYTSFSTSNFSSSTIKSTNLQYTITPSNNEFGLGLIYHFI